MSTHVLVPMDGSPLSRRALEVALEAHADGTITVFHAIDPVEPGYSYHPFDSVSDLDSEPRHGSPEWYDRAETFAEDLFADARDAAAERGVDVETELVVGDPARAIVEYAVDHDVDHVVIGSHGRDEDDARLLLGSVTEAVAFRAPTRVTLVR